jgi:hypothetical protein
MEEKFETIADGVKKYFELFDELNNRRALWSTQVKEVIYKTLTQINSNFEHLVWHVGKNETIKNLEAVYWTMGEEISGFTLKNKHLIRHGGYLNFAQLANGKVIVMISYPYIEDGIRDEIQPKNIGEYHPSKITEELIIEKAEEFIEEINDWMLNLDK